MNWEKYKDVIDFSPLKALMAERGLTLKGVADLAGTKDYIICNYISKKTLPNTEALARLCAALQCSADKVVKFTGYDVKDAYKVPWDGYGKSRWNRVTYNPLKILFKNFYGNDWRTKMTEFYDKIPKPDLSEAQKEAQQRRLDGIKSYWQKKQEEEGQKKSVSTRHKEGLSQECRNCIASDDPIPLPRLYDICKALHCTPDWVMTYN